MKCRYFSIFTIIILLTACSSDSSSSSEKENSILNENKKLTMSLKEKDSEIESLNQSLAEVRKQNDNNLKEKEIFPIISNLTKEFVQAHTTGDKKKLRLLLADEIFLEERDNKIFSNNNANEEWVLFNSENKNRFDDWVIQGFQYFPESNTFTIHIREFYTDLQGKPESPPTFLTLTFKFSNDQWKVGSLYFDV